MVSAAIPKRVHDSRKGQNGIVAVVGGSWLYHGAPTLACMAALRSGVDLVYLAVPKGIVPSIRAISPNFIVLPLADAKLTLGSVNRLLTWLPSVPAAVVGPGMGKQKTTGLKRLVGELASRGTKTVLDADALTPEVTGIVGGKPSVVTPHAGEFKRLYGIDPGTSLEERISAVKANAAHAGVTVLLKGPIDVISDGVQVATNRTGCSAMTVGGTGDVLAGLVAGIMSKGVPPFEAAAIGAYINGLAGQEAAERLGDHILATDVIDMIPLVMKRLGR